MLFVGALLAGGTVDAVRITVKDAEHAITLAWTYYLSVVNGVQNPRDTMTYKVKFPVVLYSGARTTGNCWWKKSNFMLNCGIPHDCEMADSDVKTLKNWFENKFATMFSAKGSLVGPNKKQSEKGIHQVNAIYNGGKYKFNFHIPVYEYVRKPTSLLRTLVQ